jgi:hypothetical protein
MLSKGYYVGLFTSTGDLRAIYQCIEEGVMELMFGGPKFPLYAEEPQRKRVASDFLVLTQAGFDAMRGRGAMETGVVPFANPKSSVLQERELAEINKLMTGRGSGLEHIREVDHQVEQGGLGGRYLKDLSSAGLKEQATFADSLSFRVACFNESKEWISRAGETCNLESVSTARNVLYRMPPSLSECPAVSPHALVALLGFSFKMLDVLAVRPELSKKVDYITLAHFLKRNEILRSVKYVELTVYRLFQILGLVTGASEEWKRVSAGLIAMLSDKDDKTFAPWSTIYVVKLVSAKLVELSWFMAQASTGSLKKNVLEAALTALLTFDYNHELPLYLSSNEFASKSQKNPWDKSTPKTATSNQVGLGAKNGGWGGSSVAVSTTGGLVRSVGTADVTKRSNGANGAVSEEWCINAAAEALGMQGVRCSRESCHFTHPQIVKPLGRDVKDRLTNLASRITKKEFRGKFIDAIR